MKDQPIGIFDSGIGGLTVLQKLMDVLPNEHYIYVGDNKHCPYGDKTRNELYDYACNIIDYLISRDVKMIVIACNTTSANVLDALSQKYNKIKLIGVIEATCKQLMDKDLKKTLVIATKATVISHAYKTLIESIIDDIKVDELMTPSLVPSIEAGDKNGLVKALHSYLDDIIDNYDSLVLGCTHYAIAQIHMHDILTQKKVFNSSVGVAKEVDEYLNENNLKGNKKKIQIYTTGEVEQFVSSSRTFFDYCGVTIKKLSL